MYSVHYIVHVAIPLNCFTTLFLAFFTGGGGVDDVDGGSGDGGGGTGGALLLNLLPSVWKAIRIRILVLIEPSNRTVATTKNSSLLHFVFQTSINHFYSI